MNTSLRSRRQINAVAFPYIGRVSGLHAVRSQSSSRHPWVKLEQIKHDASRLRGGRSSGVSGSPWLRMNLLMLGTFILTLAIGLTVIFWP